MQLQHQLITTPANYLVYYTPADEWTQCPRTHESMYRAHSDAALFSRVLLTDTEDQDKYYIGVILPRFIKPGRRVDMK